MTHEILIKNAQVWISADREVVRDGSVLIRDGRIARVGRFHARAETVIDATSCVPRRRRCTAFTGISTISS